MPDSLSNIIYLDHAAATPLSRRARAAMDAVHEYGYGNPSSLHVIGRQARDTLEHIRTQTARLLAVDAGELIYTSSGTESDNLALYGLAHAHRAYGTHIIVSAIEHKAVLSAARQLEREGFLVTYLPVDTYGRVSVDALRAAVRPDTILVSIMYANNEIGTIQPIRALVDACRTFNPGSLYPLFHTDACQATGMLPTEPRLLGVDAMTINSAKIYGPKGVGLLYVRAGVRIEPCIVGGDQEHGRRAGTEQLALIAGFYAALQEAVEQRAKLSDSLVALRDYFIDAVCKEVPDAQLNGHPYERLPQNAHFTIPDIEGESLLLLLSEQGICCATGSACSSRDLEPSHVLSAIGQDAEVIHGSIRCTLGRSTTAPELLRAAYAIGTAVRQLRRMTACTTAVYQRKRLFV